MDLRQLRYFLTVAEERRFSAAARRLHIAAPSLSQQIRALERDLRVTLFDRTSRGAELTPAGRVLLERAGKLVRREDLMHEVWDPAWFGSTKTLDVHVSALRKKLGDDPSSSRYIHTVRGVGFRFAAPEELR